MNLGVHIPNFGPFSEAGQVADLARRAEEAGWGGVFIWDHVARSEGDFPMLEPWVGLTAMAMATTRVRLGPLITPLARRRPWNVARQVASLDHLTGGRMILGVGLGVSRGPEMSRFSEEADPRRRGDMLDEGLDILRQAWTGDPVTHQGEHYRVDGVPLLPPPVQGSSLPIWGATERVDGRPVRRAAALDGVFPFGLTPEQIPQLVANIARYRSTELGGYEVVAADTGDPRPWQDAGATWWLLDLSWREPLAESIRLIEAGPPRI